MRLSTMIGLGLLGGCLSLPACGGGDDDDDGAGGSGGSGGKGGSSGSAGKGGSAGSSAGKGGSAGSSAGKGGSAGSSAGEGGTAGSEGGNAGADAAGAAGSAGAGTGEAGSANAGAGGAPGGSGAAGEGGVPASGGTPGEGGAGGDASGGLQSIACADLPASVTLGAALELNSFGAVLCAAATAECRLTTNTFSDGPNPCEFADNVGFFKELEGARSLMLNNGWTIASATAGTIDGTETALTAIPVGTEITAVIVAPDDAEYDVTFTFGAGQAFTLTAVTERT